MATDSNNNNNSGLQREYLVYYEQGNDVIHEGVVPLLTYPCFIVAKLSDKQVDEIKEDDIIVQSMDDKTMLAIGRDGGLVPRSQFYPPSKSSGASDAPVVWLLQFSGPIKDSWITFLQNKGVQLSGYIHPYTVFAFMKPSFALDLEMDGLNVDNEWVVEWVVRYSSTYKTPVGPSLMSSENIVVHYFPWANDTQINTMSRNVSSLASSESVLFVEPYLTPHLMNDEAKKITETQVAYENGINGTGEILAITDTGIYRSHEVFQNTKKILAIVDIAGDSSQSGGDGDGHGTHVAGSVAGNVAPYNESNKEDGQAISANLVDVKVFNNQGDWAAGNNEHSFWQRAYQEGAKVNNNSWGADSAGLYTSTDQNADRIVVDNIDYVLTVANGNAGPGRQTVGSPGVAKNVISVGAVRSANPQDVSNFSSRGPTQDGRIKPDVMAPGAMITSAKTQSTNGYVDMQGTSMATPQVTGIAGLVREYFKDGIYESGPLNPSAALVKAMLINGAVEISGQGSDSFGEGKVPNNSQGWGLVNVRRTLPFAGVEGQRKIKVWDIPVAPATGNRWSSTYNLEEGFKELKITLVWTDAPASPNTSVSLVNNLNLRVMAPDGSVFLGNNFREINPSYSITGGSFDVRNNVEGVHLLGNKSFPGNLPTGQYTIEVLSTNMTGTNKGFAVVAGAEEDESGSDYDVRVAIIGDYQDQLKNILIVEGYTVNSFAPNDYSLIPAVKNSYYDVIVINKAANTTQFDALLQAAKDGYVGVVFLGSYPVNNHGLGVLSNRTKTPSIVLQDWNKGVVKGKIVGTHEITSGFSSGSTITLINGGDNDYQTWQPSTNITTIVSNAMPSGATGMVGAIGSDRVLLGSLGVSQYTNTTHWTPEGKHIFINAVNWVGGFEVETYRASSSSCVIV